MAEMLRWRCVGVVAVACCGILLGCGGTENVTVTGTIVRDGKPIPLSPTGTFQVTLKPDVGPNEEYMLYGGTCDSAGSFQVPDVPPGNYIVGIELMDPDPISDKLRGAFSVRAEKIKRSVDGKAPLTIDLARPE